MNSRLWVLLLAATMLTTLPALADWHTATLGVGNVIFGGGPSYAVHPSNTTVALVALSATFVFDGPKGIRTVAASEFFQLPSKNPQVENSLAVAEVLTEVRIAP